MGARGLQPAEPLLQAGVEEVREAGEEQDQRRQQVRQLCRAFAVEAAAQPERHAPHAWRWGAQSGARGVERQVSERPGEAARGLEDLAERERAERVAVEAERRHELERDVAQLEHNVERVPTATQVGVKVDRDAQRRGAARPQPVGEQVRRGRLKQLDGEGGVEAAEREVGKLHANLAHLGVGHP